jgi:hypothetical protein
MHEKKVEYLALLDLKDNSVNMTKAVHMLLQVKTHIESKIDHHNGELEYLQKRKADIETYFHNTSLDMVSREMLKVQYALVKEAISKHTDFVVAYSSALTGLSNFNYLAEIEANNLIPAEPKVDLVVSSDHISGYGMSLLHQRTQLRSEY